MPNYKLDYTPDAEKDMKMYKKSGEHIALKKLDMLLKELELHPPNWHWTTRTIKVLQKQRNLVASYHQKAPISL